MVEVFLVNDEIWGQLAQSNHPHVFAPPRLGSYWLWAQSGHCISQLRSFHICQFGRNHISAGECITSCLPSSLCNFALLLQFRTVFRISLSTKFIFFQWNIHNISSLAWDLFLNQPQYFCSEVACYSSEWVAFLLQYFYVHQRHISNWVDKILVQKWWILKCG